MIAFPSQEKVNALYTLHNRIFHLSDSGIEYQIYLIFNSFIIIFRLECLVIFSIHLSFLSDLDGVCKILNSFLNFIRPGVFYQVLKSFSIFIRPGGRPNSIHLSFLSDLESRPQIINFSNQFAMERNPGLDSIPLLIIISSILSDNVIHAQFVG